MGARNQESKNVKFYSLKAKVDATNDPFFSLTEKVGESWAQTGTFTEMFGTITKAETIEKEFEGVKSNLFRLQLTDENEVSYLDMTHNGITYSILNTLSSDFDVTKEVTIRVYKKVDEKDGKTYYNGRAYLESNGTSLNWGVDIKDVPKAEQVVKKDGTPLKQNGFNVYDKEAVIKFWEDLFKEKIQNKFVAKSEPSTSTETSTETKVEKPQTKKQEEVDDEDLPF